MNIAKNQALQLSSLISAAMNSDDEIDRTYLLEAVRGDLALIHEGRAMRFVRNLIDYPIS